HSGCGFSVTSGDGDNFRIGKLTRELYFRNHWNAGLAKFHHDRHRIRNTRTLHNQVRVKQQRFGVFAAFVSDVVKQQHLFVIVPDFARIRYKDVKPLLFTQNGRSYAAFASAKYYESLHFSAVSGLRWI